ncbi:RAMP superfamily CRISPR-associated protein [Kyrpidia spormannii]|uniref:Uncharacterized protein n=1 Tax=Kyrpidia spormannii TaxID=2055160 RepID=A0ACA8ZEZ1_9BACL|nr:RAMP superfamily CRISPR-associated protein [Kyrpidia spormannii]CAB3394566.1 conserved protein of unknown function [Kyrpidia spormannii]
MPPSGVFLSPPFHFYPVDPNLRRQPPRHRNILDGKLVHGRLLVKLRTLTQLIVGTGEYELSDDRFVRAIQREQGIPVIPGSTVRGVLRQYVELLSKSCVLFKDNGQGRDLPRSLSCKTSSDGGQASVCPACQLFGIVGKKITLSGLVSAGTFRPIGDAREEEVQIPQLYRPQHTHQDNNIYFRKVYCHGNPKYILDAIPKWIGRRSESFRAVSAQVEYAGYVDVENCTPEEVGLVVLALGAVPQYRFDIKMGYAKPAFFGSIRATVEEAYQYDPARGEKRPLPTDTLWTWTEQYLDLDPWHRERINEVCHLEQFDAAQQHLPQDRNQTTEYLGWDLKSGVYR